ncbi:MAG TPA: glycogen synthase GlgA, partial [Candidatus Merdenecus merdavium]|nr:glycogen synthase GlgA [Candidatus Merdenecus merdavium]
YDVRVILPKYICMKEEYKNQVKYLANFYMDLSWRSQYVGIHEMVYEGIHFYFIDNEYYFAGPRPYGNIYEDVEKFAFFSKAALSALPIIGFQPDIVHCHDWQTGLIPVFLKDKFHEGEFFRDMKSIITIHNLKFQGIWDMKTIKDITGLPSDYFTPDKLEAYGDANYLKGGIVYADAVTTVSSTYAEEIKTPFYGENLDGLMRARSNSLWGIVNGIDYDEYDPNTDSYIIKNYNAKNFRKEKFKNKLALQKELGLEEDSKKFMIGIVSRLTDQKGFDLIEYRMDQLCQEDIQIVVLGTGEERYENMFRHFAWKYHDRVSANIYYSEEMSHKIYASCDAFLMPSLFEPCGLSQLMSLRYGTVPIVRETGGLKDTVEPYNEFENTGTGFSFANYNAHEMEATINYAKDIFYNKKREWNKIVDRGMAMDFSWTHSAKKYEELYRNLLNG